MSKSYYYICSNCGTKHKLTDAGEDNRMMILGGTKLKVSSPSCFCGSGFDAQIKVMGD